MIKSEKISELKNVIQECVNCDQNILDELRNEIRPLKSGVKKIQPRSATSVSLVGTDGGNNQLEFDPYLVQLVRVVDSSNNEYHLDAVSPTTPIEELNFRHLNKDHSPKTVLGEMMVYLGKHTLPDLSHMIRPLKSGKPVSATWVQVYRELVEWATLFNILDKKNFGTDTLIVFDGLLRSKVFSGDLFQKLIQGISNKIQTQFKENGRQIFLVGIAKHSKVLSRYRLAMALENILKTGYPAFVEVPRDIEEKAYIWAEYARGDDVEITEGAEINKYVGGKMFLVKLGSRQHDPIWPIDIFSYQSNDAPKILGYLLADATNGFPVPHYPLCLQKAHENAALVGFDFDILQDSIRVAIRESLGAQASILDEFELQDTDPSSNRYK